MNSSSFSYQDLLNESNINADNLIVNSIQAASITDTGIAANSLVKTDSNQVLSAITLTNGQLPIGNTGAAPTASTLTGTANRVIVTNGPGSITLSTPQDIATNSNVTFNTVAATATTNQLILGTTNTTTINSIAPSASRVVRIFDAGANSDFVLTEGAQTINGAKNFLLTTTFTDINANSISPNITDTYRIGNSLFRYLELTAKNLFSETLDSPTGTFQILDNTIISGTITATNLSGTNTGDVTLANIGSVPNAQGASLSGQQLTLQPASDSFGGVVTAVAQSFAGVKTFKASVLIDAVGGNLTIQGTNSYLLINSTSPSAFAINNTTGVECEYRLDTLSTPRLVQKWHNTTGYQLNDVQAGTTFMRCLPSSGGISFESNDVTVTNITQSTSTITGALKVNGGVGIQKRLNVGEAIQSNATTNQLVLGTPFLTTITSPQPLANRTVTLPDAGANSSFVLTELAQTINGLKTFGEKITVNKVGSIFKKEVSGGSTIICGRSVDNATFITFQDEAAVNEAHIGIEDSNGGGLFGGNPNAFALGTPGARTVAFFSNNTRAAIIATNQEITIDIGIKLPTSGGTSTLLNYYEQNTESITWTGAFSVNQASTLTVTRTGRVVTLMIPGVLATGGSVATISLLANISARFRPAFNVSFAIQVRDNGVTLATPGMVRVFNAGNIIIYKDYMENTFTGAGDTGFFSTCLSYSV